MLSANKIKEIENYGKKNGWSDIELEHAINNLDNEYGDETIIVLTNGRQMHCPAYPQECDYVRITQGYYELAYWISDEWAESPAEVMGAIMGCAHGK